MQFDFENLTPWDPNAQSSYLGVGDHLVTIDYVTSDKNDNGNNRLTVQAHNDNGERRDSIIYTHENGARKIVALCVATGVPLPTATDQAPDGQLSQTWADQFAGKRAGMVVREGRKGYGDDPDRMVPKVQGWVHASQLTADAPADMPEAQTPISDDDIPF